jgi:hypothetical protein
VELLGEVGQVAVLVATADRGATAVDWGGGTVFAKPLDAGVGTAGVFLEVLNSTAGGSDLSGRKDRQQAFGEQGSSGN